MSEESPEVIVSRPIPPKGKDPAIDEMLARAVTPSPGARWEAASAGDVVADLRAAVDNILKESMVPTIERPFVVSPANYAKAQDLLGIHDRPLTNADMWEAAQLEIKAAGLDPFEVLAQMHARMSGGW